MKNYKAPLSHLLNPGHSACAGCGMIIAYRLVLDAAGEDVIVANATGCSEVTTTQYPMTAFKIPWIHGLFENPSAIASGIAAALRYRKEKTKVMAVGGDGATFDIGLGLVSGLWERNDDVLYVCFDNEAYQNTGYQSSGATPLGADTTTTPPGKKSLGSRQEKKDMIAIALAHHIPYIATATTGYPLDIMAKVKKALVVKGSKYLQIYTPCVPGWGIEPKDTINVSQLAVQSGFYPIIAYENGQLTGKMKIKKKVPVGEFLKNQKRFKHLFKSEEGKKEIARIQALADKNIVKYQLIQEEK